jgi:hypothetical protein
MGQSAAARLPQAAAIKESMDLGSVIGSAPLTVGVLIALGGILVMVSYLSE